MTVPTDLESSSRIFYHRIQNKDISWDYKDKENKEFESNFKIGIIVERGATQHLS